MDELTGLPGEDLVRAGLADFRAGRASVPACVIAVAQTRLQRAGLLPAGPRTGPPESELQLYALLRQQGGDAYSRYNALVRELVSFEQALDHRQRRHREKSLAS
jgi:hypothetical protein